MQIRRFQDSDFDELASMLGHEWHSAKNEREFFWLGADELCAHLSEMQESFLAEEDGKILGIALVNDGCVEPSAATAKDLPHDRWLAKAEEIAAQASAEAGFDSQVDAVYVQDEDAILAEVAQKRGTEGTGMLALLFVASQARGRGVGRELMRCAMEWFAQRGLERYRLVTDDGCDWQLYEHLGLERAAARKSGTDEDFMVYVYEDTVAHTQEKIAPKA